MNIILTSLEQQFFCKLVCNETQKKKSIYVRVEITRATAVLRQQQNLFSNWYFKKITTVSNLARLGYLFIPYVNLPFCQKRVSRRDAELISLQFKLTKFRLLILACLARKIHILAKK